MDKHLSWERARRKDAERNRCMKRKISLGVTMFHGVTKLIKNQKRLKISHKFLKVQTQYC